MPTTAAESTQPARFRSFMDDLRVTTGCTAGVGHIDGSGTAVRRAPRNAIHIDTREADVEQLAFVHGPEVVQGRRCHPPRIQPAVERSATHAYESCSRAQTARQPEQGSCGTETCPAGAHRCILHVDESAIAS